MKINNFEILICSPYDKERLVCEIYYKDELLAQISQEYEILLLEIFSTGNNKYWSIPLNEFQKVIDTAKHHLIGEK